jgi:hypothetical protein
MSELAKGAVQAHVLGGGSAALSPFAAFAGRHPVHANPRGRRARDVDGRCPPTVLLLTTPEPSGASYVLPGIEGLEDSLGFCRRLLVEQHVGLAPGSAFGGGGEGSVRICFAAKRLVLEQALERLERFLRGGALGRGGS